MSVDFHNPSIHLGTLLREHIEAQGSGEFTQLGYIQNGSPAQLTVEGVAHYDVQVHNVGDDYFWLAGQLRAVIPQECARCLRDVAIPLNLKLGVLLRYEPKSEEPYLDEDENGQEVWVFVNPELDLGPYFAETLMMALPMSVLHDPNCKGLCMVCGTDLNESTCEHAQVVPITSPEIDRKDNPFAALADLDLPDA